MKDNIPGYILLYPQHWFPFCFPISSQSSLEIYGVFKNLIPFPTAGIYDLI